MNDQTDQQLLRDYAERQSEAAFAAIVQRYVDLIYSAALRLSCDAHAAKDVTQSVFVVLAQNARQLTDRPALAGWLHGTARNLAVKAIRSDVRRRAREQEAAVMNELLSTHPDASWEHIAPHLDDALGELSEPDRDAVLLRYFKNHDLRTVGATLGISDDAAQKRVSRAVERLRDFFAKRGISIGAGGLAVVISANAVQAAPVGLALTISTAAALTGTTLATTATVTATKAIAMTALQKTIVTATIAVLAGAGIYEARQASQLREQVHTLQQQQTALIEQIKQLHGERDDATNKLVSMIKDITKTRSNNLELLRLRSEVSRLRSNLSQPTDSTTQAALAWVAKKEKLQNLFEERPDQQLPEMESFTEGDWLGLVKDLRMESEKDLDHAMHFVRASAKMNSAPIIRDALKKFVEANNGNWPEDVAQLKPFFDYPNNDAILHRYKTLNKAQAESGWLKGMILVEKIAVNKWSEPQVAIGPTTWTQEPPPAPVHLTLPEELNPAMQSFMRAHQNAGGGQWPFQEPEDFTKLSPYITTPEQKAALEIMIKMLNGSQAP
ncbi:MAG: sigma-70 family RNA polymerase sigma factor [Verrucomicrobia bacterium]|nr:sigma-70 family RNA polymerase sigma factor [Verrucomicrobiota bacterium]